MSKNDVKATEGAQNLFPDLKSYSVDEIMAAGGTTAFAEKMGKDFKNIEARLKKLPKDAFLTEEEAETALKMLRERK